MSCVTCALPCSSQQALISRLNLQAVFVIPGQTRVTEDADNPEVLLPSLPASHLLGCSDVHVWSCPHRSGAGRVPGWSWKTSRAAGSDVCPTGASRNATTPPSSPRSEFSRRRLRPSVLLSSTSTCRSSSRSGTGSAAWTSSRDVSTTWSTSSATTRQVRAATAGNSGTWASTRTSGSGQCGSVAQVWDQRASLLRL